MIPEEDRGYNLLVLDASERYGIIEFDGQNSFALCIEVGLIKDHPIRLTLQSAFDIAILKFPEVRDTRDAVRTILKYSRTGEPIPPEAWEAVSDLISAKYRVMYRMNAKPDAGA